MEKDNENYETDQIDADTADGGHNIEDELDLLGKQVSMFMNETEQLVEEQMEEDKEDPSIDGNFSKSGIDEKQKEIHKEEEAFLPDETGLEDINDSLAQQVNSAISEDTILQEGLEKKKKKKKIIIISASVAVVLILALCLILFTKAGQKKLLQSVVAPNVYDGMFEYEETVTVTPAPDSDVASLTQDQTTDTVTNDQVVNILLVGVEEIEYAQNTDTMIIASMNRETNELSIISLMRDLYVQIPGHGQNKLNAVYAFGGMDLLYQTIELNFGVKMNGYILVNFSAFETVVDLLGGLNITLTQNEANYLNRTNYISNPAYRTVVAGTQKMNGNQVLGYCRIRYVSTGKESNDFGRTARHRVVLNEMFNQLMGKNPFELISFMNKVFEQVQLRTDISKTKFSDYVTEIVDLNLSELEQYRLPLDDSYTDDKVYIGDYKQWVLIPNDWSELKKTLQDYLYGE